MLMRRALGLLSLINFAAIAAFFGARSPTLPNAIASRTASRRHIRRPSPTLRYFPRGKLYTPNGKREVARRLRQIEAGQLRVTA